MTDSIELVKISFEMKIGVQPFFLPYRCKKPRREFCIAVTIFTKIDFRRFRSRLVEVEKRFDMYVLRRTEPMCIRNTIRVYETRLCLRNTGRVYEPRVGFTNTNPVFETQLCLRN
jgi:hypothetical protein